MTALEIQPLDSLQYLTATELTYEMAASNLQIYFKSIQWPLKHISKSREIIPLILIFDK
jgi:hypothetical protein